MAQTLREAEMIVSYEVDSFLHKVSFGVRFDTPDPDTGTDPLLVLKDATTATSTVVATAFANAIKAKFTNACSITAFEVWDRKRDADGFAVNRFIFAGTLGITGTAAGTFTAVKQNSFMYRSSNGKVGRIILLGTEGTIDWGTYARPLSATSEAVATWIEGNSSPIIHPDGGRPLTCYAMSLTSNNALERRIFNKG